MRKVSAKAYRALRSSRRKRLRHYRRNPIRGAFSGIGGTFKELLSSEMLKTAGGAVAASALTSFVLSKFGPTKVVNGVAIPKAAGEFKLPFSDNRVGLTLYSVGIPTLGAALVGKWDRDVAKGMIISGLVMAINEAITTVQGSLAPVASTKEYFVPAPRIDRALAAPVTSAGYDAVQAFGSPTQDRTPQGAFAVDAWHN